MSCQIKYINEIGIKNSFFNNLKQNIINILRPTKSYLIFIKRKINNHLKLNRKVVPQVATILPGDIVEVLKKEEIKSILNEWRKYNGCAFMDQMYDFCGKKYKVMKKIDHFYDEKKQRIVNCKDIVLLEGVTCNGKRTLYKAKCDRNCFLFWHTAWLKKIDNREESIIITSLLW